MLVVCDMNLQYPRYHCTTLMFLLVDSHSIVEQSQKGCDSSCKTLLTVIPSSVKYSIPYACQLASCNMGITFPVFFSSAISYPTGLCRPFYLGFFLIEPWDSLSGYVHAGIACLASKASDWAGVFWGSLFGLWLATFC